MSAPYQRVRLEERGSTPRMGCIGGATLISSLINRRIVDELRLDVHPVVLGGRKRLFNGVRERHQLQLVEAKANGSGQARLIYASAG
jgi:dihydrofolate reductase